MSTTYANASIKAPFLLTDKPYVCTSPFGMRTLTIGGKTTTSKHWGMDFGPMAQVCAMATGKVTAVRSNILESQTPEIIAKAQVDLYGGNKIEVSYGNGQKSTYSHLAYGSILVKVGDIVKKNQPLATIGKTGYVTGPHLHLGFIAGGYYVDPLPYILGKIPIVDYPTNPKMTALDTPTLTILASVLNYRDAPNGSKVLGQLLKGATYQCTRKSEILGGYEWAEILLGNDLVYTALNPLWNTLTSGTKIIEKVVIKEVYQPLDKVFEDAEVRMSIQLTPKVILK